MNAELIQKNSKTQWSIQTDGQCTDSSDSLNIDASTISRHIKELVNGDLISTEKKGGFLICRINEGIVDFFAA